MTLPACHRRPRRIRPQVTRLSQSENSAPWTRDWFKNKNYASIVKKRRDIKMGELIWCSPHNSNSPHSWNKQCFKNKTVGLHHWIMAPYNLGVWSPLPLLTTKEIKKPLNFANISPHDFYFFEFVFNLVLYLISYIMYMLMQVYVTKYTHHPLPILYTYILSLLLILPRMYFTYYLLPGTNTRSLLIVTDIKQKILIISWFRQLSLSSFNQLPRLISQATRL